jgi:hypothetical protein
VSRQPECALAFTLREAKVGNHVRRAGLEAAVDFDTTEKLVIHIFHSHFSRVLGLKSKADVAGCSDYQNRPVLKLHLGLLLL